jgi:hypothetical protein
MGRHIGTKQHERVAFGCRVSKDVRVMIEELATYIAGQEDRFVSAGEIVERAVRALHAKITIDGH